MAKQFLDKDERAARLLVVIGVFVVFFIGVLIPTFSHKNETIYRGAEVRPGFETAPATWTISASPHKVWTDYWHAGGWAVVIGGFIFAAVGCYWYITWASKNDRTGTWKGIAGFVVGGALLIFVGYVSLSDKIKYTGTFSVEQYEANRANLDGLFPIVK